MSAAERPDLDETDPAALTAELDRLRHEVRSTGRAAWFPLVLFGGLVLLAVPFVLPWGAEPSAMSGPRWVVEVALVFGGVFTPHPVALGFYWLAALAAGFIGSGLYYRHSGGRTGLRRPVRAFGLTGLVIVLLLMTLRYLPVPYVSGFTVQLFRGTTAVAAIAVALVVLASLERSGWLVAVSIVFLAVAVLVNSYNVENLVFDLGVPYASWWTPLPNVVLPGLVLLTAGAVTRRRARRAERAARS